ncbi:hypothetical protein ACFQY7_52455 [Actinomadura luteofluorescens]|uniref:2-oxoglutarate dehydrogenase E1 subunit family protein n=1 Tax=Actinomadura luteofluorescens TaxID=46163 RepID=UPI003637F4EA
MLTDFGANEWLVDELYQKYLDDPNSVDEAWWNFFADYQPGSRPVSATPQADGAAPKAANGTAAAPPTPQPPKAPARPAAKAPAPKADRLRPHRCRRGPRRSGCAASPPGRPPTWRPASACRRRRACAPSRPSC